ncbi:hypothetical protein D3C78_1378940 [compost metagenome]
MKNAFAVTFNLRHGKCSERRQFLKCDRPGVMLANVDIDGRQPLIGWVIGLGFLQIVRNAGHADNFALRVVQRQLLRQAPTGLASVIQMHFQLILDQLPVTQHAEILLGIPRSELGGENVRRGFAQQRRDGFKPTAFGQRQIGEQITGLHVFDEEHHVGHGIEQRGDQRQGIKQVAQSIRPLLCQAVAPAGQLLNGENVIFLFIESGPGVSDNLVALS